jgi:hypothetical protein
MAFESVEFASNEDVNFDNQKEWKTESEKGLDYEIQLEYRESLSIFQE